MRQRFHYDLSKLLPMVGLALLAGCASTSPAGVPPASAIALTVARSGAVSPVPPSMRAAARRLLSPAVVAEKSSQKGHLYIGQFSSSNAAIEEYHLNNKKNRPPLCSLPGEGINGIATDHGGHLWVPNGTGGGQGFTQEYAPNCGAPLLKITDNDGQPADVAFDNHKRIYILSIFGKSGAPGSVDVYNSSGTLLRSLTDSTFSELIGVASDSHGNIFVSNRQSNGDANVLEFRHGKMPGTVLSGISLGLPGAPQFDSSNNLIITDWLALTLNVYAPPYNGSPKITAMSGLSLWCPLDRSEKHLYCADTAGSVDVYAYPSGTYLYSFTNGLSPSGFATGAAVAPEARL